MNGPTPSGSPTNTQSEAPKIEIIEKMGVDSRTGFIPQMRKVN